MTGPNQQKINKQAGCNTCGAKWVKSKELKNSNCQFCGISNCKICLRKTRFFRVQNAQDCSALRGKCCKLCDRKFIIREMVSDSLQMIKS